MDFIHSGQVKVKPPEQHHHPQNLEASRIYRHTLLSTISMDFYQEDASPVRIVLLFIIASFTQYQL